MPDNKLTINFTPPSPAPALGYRIKYREYGSSSAYVEVLTTDPPPIIIDNLLGSVTRYEGTIESRCGETDFSIISNFATDTFCNCDIGYTALSNNSGCQKVLTEAAIEEPGSSILACHFTNVVYGQYGTVFYQPGGYNTNGTYTTTPHYLKTPNLGGSYLGTLWGNQAGNTTNGRLNQTGIWKCGDQDYSATPLGFVRQITLTSSKQYYIGLGADNYASIKVNGVTIVNQDPSAIGSQYGGAGSETFKFWHVYPVNLNAGVNLLEITGTNSGANGVFGCEIYDASESQLMACNNETDLMPYLVFTTDNIPSLGVGNYVADNDDFAVGNYSCASSDYSLAYESGGFICKKVLSLACGESL